MPVPVSNIPVMNRLLEAITGRGRKGRNIEGKKMKSLSPNFPAINFLA
jgi:hypothetical protein